MYKVILVDDEKRIVEGLSKIVDWPHYNCEVVATAGDAAEGSRLIRELKPDILFTDIRMPGKNGLAMIAGLRSEFPSLQIAVLTGYRDFSYAQEAIRLGVCRFLLKPSKMAEINEALEEMTKRLDAGRSAEASPTPAEETAAGNFLVKQAVKYMEQHYAEKLTLQDVANHCYVSHWHLSKLLNGQAGKSFYDILNEIRIENAKVLLADRSLKIAEIGERVGYSDPAHFAKSFRKITGISANEYRNSLF